MQYSWRITEPSGFTVSGTCYGDSLGVVMDQIKEATKDWTSVYAHSYNSLPFRIEINSHKQ